MQELLDDKIGYKLRLEEQRERLEMLAVENQQLKERMQELEGDSRQLRANLKQAKTDGRGLEEAKQSMEKIKTDKEWVEKQLKARDSEVQEHRLIIQNLQKALSNSQNDHELILSKANSDLAFTQAALTKAN